MFRTALRLCCLALPGVAQEFQFGEAADLEVRVLSAKALGGKAEATWLELEVENTGELAAEPLVFELLPKRAPDGATPLRLERVPEPHFGRSGRSIEAGGKQTYPLVVPGDRKSARLLVPRVVVASFQDTPLVVEAPVVAGKLRPVRVFREDIQRTTWTTEAVLENRSDHELDALFEATCSEPFDARTRIRCRLKPREQKTWRITQFGEGTQGYVFEGARVQKLELVDWSVIASRGREEASRRMQPVDASWLAKSGNLPDFHGRFRLVTAEGEERLGRFSVTDSGVATLFDGESSLAEPGIRSTFDRMVHRFKMGDLTRERWHEQASIHSWGEELVVQLGQDDGQRTFAGLDGVRIRWTGTMPGRQGSRTSWAWREVEGGGLVTRKSQRMAHLEQPLVDESFGYEQLEGTWVPVRYTNRSQYGGEETRQSYSLELHDLVPGALSLGPPPQPPTGPLADALRKAWRSVYHYPDEPVTLSGRFEITQPGTGAEWMGQREVSGTFVLEGFRGTRWRRWTIEVEGEQLTPRTRSQLASIVEDRFRMWAWRDPGGRAPFERAFAGASLSGKASSIEVDAGTYRRIDVVEGRPAGLRFADGRERQLVWRKVGGAFVPTRIQTGDEVLEAKWKKVHADWILPVDVTLREVWPDFGPERLVLEKLQVRRP